MSQLHRMIHKQLINRALIWSQTPNIPTDMVLVCDSIDVDSTSAVTKTLLAIIQGTNRCGKSKI